MPPIRTAQVSSTTSASGAFFFTDSMPFLAAALLSYASPTAMICPLLAFSRKLRCRIESVRNVRGLPPTVRGERVVTCGVRDTNATCGASKMDPTRFSVRKVRHRDGRLSYWIFTPDGEVHRPALDVLTRYGTSSQQTYAYCLRCRR